MFKLKFEDKDKGYANWQKGLGFLGGKQSKMEVGLLEGITDPEDIRTGAINEVGVPRKNIPARRWLRDTIDRNDTSYLRLLGDLYLEELESGMKGGDARIKRTVGELIASDLRRAITQFHDPENADATVKKKGFNNPLVENGNLQHAPTFRVYPPGQEPKE